MRPTYVYFIMAKRTYPRPRRIVRVKIGLSYDVERRKRELQTGSDRLLVHYRKPLYFPSEKQARAFENWAHM